MTHPEKAAAPARGTAEPAALQARTSPNANGAFVINLCSSNTPMSLVRPTDPALAKFTFFVSRRREEGRERFRLHMGYFASRREAENLIAVVREVYPAAWVGDAPGQSGRSEGSAASPPAAAKVVATAGPTPVPTPALPVTHAPVTAAQPANLRQASKVSGELPPIPPSNVREVLALLDGATPVRTKVTRASQEIAATLSASAPPPVSAPPARGTAPNTLELELEPSRVAGGSDLSDSQVLRVLESHKAQHSESAQARLAGSATVPLQRPQDTMSWQEIRDEVAREAQVSFSLQLQWSSVEPDTTAIPALSIFEAYTLYAVEVSRPGQRQFGLRLGFFSDALSARQVAAYVQSEFGSVAVVPVTASERENALKTGGIRLLQKSLAVGGRPSEEITLINELKAPRTVSAAPSPPVLAAASTTAGRTGGAPSAGKGGAAVAPARASRPRGSGPRTLEETLEILGASQLSIDNGKGERMDLASRGKRSADKRTSTFSKLLDRLSTKLKP